MARIKNCYRKKKPQTAKKRTYKVPRVYVQNIPRDQIHNEYRQWLNHHRVRKNQSIRKSQQCTSNTLKRRQCKKRTAHTKKCWIHLAKYDNLRIKPSNIQNAGEGLFAWKKSFAPNKKISKYTGRIKTSRQINREYGVGLAEYALCDQGICVDANYTTDAAARYVNDPRGSRFVQNSNLAGKKGNFYLKSSKIIRPHQEILTKYGDDYWRTK